MNDSKIAVRYAKALFLWAEERSMLQDVAKDMQNLLVVSQEVPELAEWYQNPLLSEEQKKDIFNKAFQGQLSEMTFRFVDVLITNKREHYLSAVVRNFIQRYNQHLGIKTAQLTTALAINESQKQQIVEIVRKAYQCKIQMQTNTNPELIGGLVLTVEDTCYDASIVTQLKNIKQELLNKTI